MSTLTYRPEVDGLRALAVLSVFVFHLRPGLLPGGFVGVDVFFVISGYLITSVILEKQAAGAFSLLEFYQRRIARIFPVLAVVAGATLAAAAALYDPRDLARTGGDTAFAMLSLANFRFLFTGGYFESSPDAQPFSHYWSLSLEEQFYLLVPPLLALLAGLRLSLRVRTGLIAALAAASLAGSLVLTYAAPDWAFFFLPTRAWELLLGSLLALAPGLGAGELPARLAPLGLVGLLISFGAVSEEQFPGYVVLPPVLCTVLLLGARRPNRIQTLLSAGPLVYVGRLSYSLYLWHWPVFAFVDYALFAQPPWLRLALKLGLPLLLSLASFHLLEQPARRSLSRPGQRRTAFLVFLAGTALLTAAGALVQQRSRADFPRSRVLAGAVTLNADAEGPEVVLLGDSHGVMYLHSLRALAQAHGLRLTVFCLTGAQPFRGRELGDAALRYVQRQRPRAVVFAANWSIRGQEDPQRLATTVKTLAAHSERLILVAQPPSRPRGASRAEIRAQGLPGPRPEPSGRARRRRAANQLLLALEEPPQVRVVDPDPLLVSPGGALVLFRAGRPVHYDDDHLSLVGSELLRPQLAQALGVSP